VTHAKTQNRDATKARRSDRTATAMTLALALAYGGGWWLEHAHPITGIEHAGPEATRIWLAQSTMLLPVTLVTVYVVLRLADRWAATPFHLALVSITTAVAVASVTALCAPLIALLSADPHAHGQIPPSWYQLGDALHLVRVDVPIAAAVILLASLEWPARRKEATPW
jgi:cytochrome bd-type quinol oxidase subunit 2